MNRLVLLVVVGSLSCGPTSAVHPASPPPSSVAIVTPAPSVSPTASAPDVPTRLRIPSIRVDSPTVTVGLMPDGSVGTPCDPTKPSAPCNVNATAWYKGSVRPGSPGSAVIDGHVDWYGPAGSSHDVPAVFARLAQLRRGALVLVTDRRGVTRTFVVDRLTYLPYPKQPPDTYDIDGPAALTLITCSGAFVSRQTGMSARLYVHATLQSSR